MFRKSIGEINEKLIRHKTLVSNFNFISILQVSQILFPLLIYPYLIRVLGKETYGIIAFSNAVIAYLVLIINFGFNISEINGIAVYRNNIERVSEIVSSVLIIRLVLTLVSILILIIVVFAFPGLKIHKWLYFGYIGILFSEAINPGFYFQGIEKMKFITLIYVLSNFIFLVLIFLIVKKKTDYALVPFLTGAGALAGTLTGLSIVFFKHKVVFSFQRVNKLFFYLKESMPFFTSRISSVIMNKTNIILIGSFVGYNEVSYYDLANKLVEVMKVPFNIFNQVLFPNISRTKNTSMVIKTLRMLIFIYVIGYISLYVLGEPLIKIIGGINLVPAKYVLYLLGLTAISELISVFLGAPILLATGHKSEYNKSLLYGCIFNLLIISGLYSFHWLGLYQLTLASVCTSIFILLYRLYYCKIFKIF